MDEPTTPPILRPVDKPLNLIPVGLKEAALDSPTFRASAQHFADQIELVEKWLEGYVKAGVRLAHEVAALEGVVYAWVQNAIPPPGLSAAIVDHDYTLLASKRYSDAARESWQTTFRNVRKSQTNIVEPIKAFINNELRAFKEARRGLEQAQRSYDSVLTRYAGQAKSKEPSSLREDAFQVHGARKAYLKASMDFCVQGPPNVRASLDKLLVKVFADQWKDLKSTREANSVNFSQWGSEMERIRGWSREMENSERAFKRELQAARKQIEESAEINSRPSRELEDYAEKPATYLGAGAPSSGPIRRERQGWLHLKSITGKPARTIWTRRWFYVKNGIFGWLMQGSRSGGVEESEKIGVLLCSVRPAAQEERRFCFEVKTKDTSIILQAESQNELSQWINAFDLAKRRALEDPGSTETSATTAGDLAFAVSPPVAPEFAARNGDGHMGQSSEDQGVSPFPTLEPSMTGPAASSSIDLTTPRRSTMDRERETESSRDHAARIIQKLDIHRKPTPSTNSAAGGIASLISASHNILPVGPGSATGAPRDQRSFTMPTSTLAPSTLANPPAPTNLSKTAVVVSGERGVGLGNADGSGMPSGIMANLWGSEKWGAVNRLERDDNRQSGKSNSVPASPDPSRSLAVTTDDVGIMDGMGEANKDFGLSSPQAALSPGARAHRKTISLNPGAIPMKVNPPPEDVFPNYYPLPLKAQDAQFRMFFPDVPRAEKVVLVFRATWNVVEQQEFPGRVYCTAKEIYFYSNHLGLVLISGVSLSTITEVTAAPGRDCDFLYVHLRDNSMPGDLRRVTIKTFLEPLKLLHRRLSFLVKNANSEEPVSLEEVVKSLLKLEINETSAPEGWEDVDNSDDDIGNLSMPGQREHDIKPSLRIDGALYGEGVGRTGREVTKFKLPFQAVVYKPQGFDQATVVRDFAISAKALFHVIFGDKSAVFSMLHRNRWATGISQSPWSQANTENTHLKRTFTWTLNGSTQQVIDTQTIDVQNDHLCYVITEAKLPWNMPLSNSFQLQTKYVITHTSKSRARLAVFHKVVWQTPAGSGKAHPRRLVEKRAMHDLEADAIDLSAVAMDQVTRLGAYSKTNKAIQIFGNVGQSTEASQLTSADAPTVNFAGASKRKIRSYTLVGLYADEAASQALRVVSMVFDVLVALLKALGSAASAHMLLVLLLVFSAAYNTWYSYRDGVSWYHERSATKYMARLGVGTNKGISHSIYLSDINDLVVPRLGNFTSADALAVGNGEAAITCKTSFRDVLESEEIDTGGATGGQGRAQARLQASRQSLGRYRHDLLVAMRVVNRVEEEVVRAEWEDWVRDETRKCEKMERLLELKREQSGNARDLGPNFDAYCQSCRGETEALRA